MINIIIKVEIKIFVFQVTLRRATEQVNKSKYVTEQQVHKVVYLLALGVQEQETDPEHCQFVTRAVEAGLVEQLARLAQDTGNSLAPDHVRRLGGEAVRRGQAGRGRHPAGRRHGDGRGGRRDREQEEESRGGEEGEDHVLLLEMFKKIQFQK